MAEWFETLEQLASRLGVRLHRASAKDGVLTLEVDHHGEGRISLDLLPLDASQRYFATTARHGLRYHGTARPDAAQERALAQLLRAVRSVEASWPATLTMRGAHGAAAGAPALFTVERATSPSGDTWTELLVRLTARCNQACPFCSGPPSHPDADPARLREWLAREVTRHPHPTVTLTGGEPGLWPGLEALVKDVLAFPQVELVRVQTNAVPFAARGRAQALVASPRVALFVSFHAAQEALYDACTATTRQFPVAVEGIDRLLEAGHPLTLNLVAQRHNAGHLEDWVRFVADRWGRAPGLRLHFSITMCPEHRPGAPEVLVRYSELGPRLVRAAALAARLGLTCDPLLSSSHAAIPPCLVPEDQRARGGRPGTEESLPLHRDDEVGEPGSGKPWVKAPCCRACAQDPWCVGLPAPYVQRFGVGELSPISPAS